MTDQLSQKRALVSIRRAVRRKSADLYILITLLSFAASVSFTRLFLQLTGYPQIGGNSELHIAHVLWGGLLLFIAALTPLLFANRWALMLDALLAGVGVGLFIDEVGKFITKTNDYFFPSAAPIIYTFFLLTVLLYLQVRRRRPPDPRTLLYGIISDLEEVLDRDLSDQERVDILRRLDDLEKWTDMDPNLLNLVRSLRRLIVSNELELAPHTPTVIEKIQAQFQLIETRWFSKSRLRLALIAWQVALGLWSLAYPLLVIRSTISNNSNTNYLLELFSHRLIRSEFGLGWFELRLALEISVGIILILSAALLALRFDRRAIDLGNLGLLLSLTVVNLFIYYFDQFSTIITSIIQLVLLLGLLYYRNHYLPTTSKRNIIP